MFKHVAATVLCAILVSACSDPKSAVVPQDLSKLDTLKPAIEKLSSPDKELFANYVMRKSIGEKFAGLFGGQQSQSPGVPAGSPCQLLCRSES